jgi:hypothetical protein
MNRAQLVELLSVERFLPLPPAPKAGEVYDDPKDQYSRRLELSEAVKAYEHDHRDDAPPMRRKGMILVADRSAA